MITNNAQGATVTDAKTNPFPGLRSFGVNESHLFFGRGGQSEIILEYLSNTRFAAVTGASGSGKSSLIYCGLIPILYGGFIPGAGASWRIIATRPGNAPVMKLAESVVESESKSIGSVFEEERKDLVYALMRRSSYGLVDAVSQMGLEKGQNLLLVIDQFEELFRYKDSRVNSQTTLNESEAYIKLLVKAAQQREIPIYIVLTMRSDFIGNCSQFQELTDLINESNYLVPQMTREDFRQAIMGPLAVAGAKIDPQLLQHLLNQIGDRTDQLPVLQHAMMRTWEFARKYADLKSPLSLRDYEAAGKLENALSMHANEAYDELDDKGKTICRSMFKTLTEKGADNKGIRHPATIEEIAEIAQVPNEDVIQVVEKFRAPGRSFLTPPDNIELKANTVIDISHESLMRVWDKLINWVEEEASSVQMYIRLSEAASMYQLGKTSLWRPPDLHLALNWKKTQKPSLLWAQKYNPAFEKAMVFLDASEKKHLQEEQNKVKLQRRTLNRTRRFAAITGAFAIVLCLLSFYAFEQKREADKLRKEAEAYAMLQEDEKDVAIEQSQQKEIERLQALREKDSLDRIRMMQILEQEEETQLAYSLLDEAESQTEELQKTTEIVQQEKALAEESARLAREKQEQVEQEKALELQKRMLSLAQSMAVKSQQSANPQLNALLALQAYQFNTDYNGPENHPDIYKGLYAAKAAIKGKDFNSKKGHDGAIRDIVFMPDRNTFYSTGADGKLLKWGLAEAQRTSTLVIKNNYVNRSLAVSADGRWLACGSGSNTLQLFNLKNKGEVPKLLEAHQGGVLAIEFIKGENKMLTAGGDRTIKIWDLLAGTKQELFTANSKIRDMAYVSRSGLAISGLDNGKVMAYNVKTKESRELYNNKTAVYKVEANRSGTRVAIGDKSGKVVLINPTSGRVARVLNAHSSRILGLKFSPDGKQLATTSFDGTIKIWNMSDLSARPIQIKEQESWVMAIDFSPNGKYLVSSSNTDDKIYVWPTSAEVIAADICPLVSRNLSRQEWDAYVGNDIGYTKTCSNK